jgi:hypothetical protein
MLANLASQLFILFSCKAHTYCLLKKKGLLVKSIMVEYNYISGENPAYPIRVAVESTL